MYKLCFYVPETHVDAVKQAAFDAGAGHVGDYDSCSWQVLGSGQFRPLAGSAPFLGQQGNVQIVPEYRVEMVCTAACIKAAVSAMLAAHPYEEPAWDVIAMVTELPQ